MKQEVGEERTEVSARFRTREKRRRDETRREATEKREKVTDLIALLLESLEEDAQQVVCVVDLVGVLSNDPDQRRLGFGLVQFVQAGAEGRNDSLVAMGVLSEDVLQGEKREEVEKE